MDAEGLRAENARLAEATRRTSEFIADVAHELRTPLASIKAYSEVLIDQIAEGDTGSLSQFLGVINGEADRLADMIADLLDLASLETGRVVPQVMPVDLAPFAAEAVAAGEARGVAVEVEGSAPNAIADHDLARRLVQSLVGAAIVLSREGGRVRIGLRGDGSWAEMTVHGDGEAIAPEDLPHALDKFYRGRSGSAIRKIGLRLALARQIADLHGGDVRVESAPERGSTYTVRLPVFAG